MLTLRLQLFFLCQPHIYVSSGFFFRVKKKNFLWKILTAVIVLYIYFNSSFYEFLKGLFLYSNNNIINNNIESDNNLSFLRIFNLFYLLDLDHSFSKLNWIIRDFGYFFTTASTLGMFLGIFSKKNNKSIRLLAVATFITFLSIFFSIYGGVTHTMIFNLLVIFFAYFFYWLFITFLKKNYFKILLMQFYEFYNLIIKSLAKRIDQNYLKSFIKLSYDRFVKIIISILCLIFLLILNLSKIQVPSGYIFPFRRK